MSPIAVALSLMREAMTLLDEPEATVIAHHLQRAITAAENTQAYDDSPLPADADGNPGLHGASPNPAP